MTSILNRLAAGTAIGLIASSALAADVTIQFGHDNKADPFENPAHACTAVFANIIGTDTNGAVEVEVFPSNQLGSAQEHVQLVRDGVLQATLTSTGALASYYPRIDVLNLPFAFANDGSTYDVFDGPFGTALAADIEAEPVLLQGESVVAGVYRRVRSGGFDVTRPQVDAVVAEHLAYLAAIGALGRVEGQ